MSASPEVAFLDTRSPAGAPVTGRISIGRTFEAILFDWDGTAVADRSADASAVRARVEDLSAAGVHVFIVSGTHVGNVDGQLRARPSGPGTLRLCVNRGSEVFEIDADGPRLLWRRVATAGEDAALDAAAAMTVARFAAAGLATEVVSQRINRRKIDLIPEREWADPPKAQIAALLAAVTERLRRAGLAGLSAAVEIARDTAREAGLSDPRITSDVKHVEIGLTDKSDSARWALADLAERGLGPGLVLIVGDEFGMLGGAVGSDSLLLVPEGRRAFAASVGVEPGGVPGGVTHIGGGPDSFLDLLDHQLARRRARRVPTIDEDPRWTLVLDEHDPRMRRVHGSLLALGDGSFCTRGTVEEDGEGTEPLVLAAGIYDRIGGLEGLLPAPRWTDLTVARGTDDAVDRRVLDLRTGVLLRERGSGFRSMRFASLARPGTMALRAEGEQDTFGAGGILVPPDDGNGSDGGVSNGGRWARTRSALGGGITAAAVQEQAVTEDLRTVERLAVYDASADALPRTRQTLARLRERRTQGFDRLLAEQRATWAGRWADAAISIHGDPDAEKAVRFALFHLLSSVADTGEAALGARGLSGPAYAGHVFWDSDVFVLPVLAATHPASARAMLEYRLRRLPTARGAAVARRLQGARFPWESAHDGSDVTPRTARAPDGAVIPIRTGEHEEHIVADVAWAGDHYVAWTGDDRFLDGPGRALLTETARYWASRVRFDGRGIAHIYGVVGPDEYHEIVDDNAFTNGMARWNLRRAASSVDRDGNGADRTEVARWRQIADALADGFDPTTLLYEQFSGFWLLDPVLIGEIATPPVAADVLLGRDRLARSQIIKQADTLMLHHMIPDDVADGSLEPNVAFYEPRTAHGSSLSPAVHAALLARAGDLDRALELFRIACRLDLDDLTGTTAGGLHIGALGGLWQALVYGFAGVRPCDGNLRIDPHLPDGWTGVDLRVRFRGARIRLHIEAERFTVMTEGPRRIVLDDRVVGVRAGETAFVRTGRGWQEVMR